MYSWYRVSLHIESSKAVSTDYLWTMRDCADNCEIMHRENKTTVNTFFRKTKSIENYKNTLNCGKFMLDELQKQRYCVFPYKSAN